jgi:hypothetical protein
MAIPDWHRGHIHSFWKNEHRTLDYQTELFNNHEDMRRWRKEGFDRPNEKFVGALCDMRKPQPLYNNRIIQWAETEFQLKDIGTSYYQMGTGIILPTHKDTFKRYIELFGCSLESIDRIVIFLEDWSSGHYFEIDETPIVDWKRGDFVKWRSDTPHMAANLGLAYRYTLQITGHK